MPRPPASGLPAILLMMEKVMVLLHPHLPSSHAASGDHVEAEWHLDDHLVSGMATMRRTLSTKTTSPHMCFLTKRLRVSQEKDEEEKCSMR